MLGVDGWRGLCPLPYPRSMGSEGPVPYTYSKQADGWTDLHMYLGMQANCLPAYLACDGIYTELYTYNYMYLPAYPSTTTYYIWATLGAH